MDWTSKNEWLDFVSPRTLWLNFNHDELPVGPLSNYPKTANFDESCLWTAKFRESRNGFSELPENEIGLRVAAFLQAWLFFGLLESVLGKKVETSYLVRQNHLYTRNLHFCLQSKVFAIRNADKSTQAQVNIDIELNLRLVHRWIDRFAAWSHPSFKPKLEAESPGLSKHLEQITPAIIRLGEAIEQMRLHALPGQDFMGTLNWRYPFGASEIRQQSLSKFGWCPFQITLLEDTVNHSTIDWIIAKGLSQESAGHETCTESSCARNNIDNDTYEQAHVCEEGQCQKLKPFLSEIIGIINRNEIPVVRLEKDGEIACLAVTTMSKTQPGDFVAVSHVWADGLGGRTETGLNMCQVQRVSDLCASVRGSAGGTWFWLDCLCIPRDCEKQIYYKALDSIKDVYKCASSVLVIDKTIGRCSTSNHLELIYAHIYLSAWMQRMWTYEEAVLSKGLVFVLKDGLHTYKVDSKPHIRRPLCVVWQSLASQLFRLRASSEDLTIGHIYQAFRYRLCNVPLDEFISVAGMLGMDTMSLLPLDGEERTKNFWLMLQWVPSNIVFLDGPKLGIPKFRWAPRTLMHPSRTAMDTEVNRYTVQCTNDGLIGEYLTVQLNNELLGKARNTGSISYIYVDSTDKSIHTQGDHRALLRVYCIETWPSEGAYFNTVIFPNVSQSVIQSGQWVPGAALQDEQLDSEKSNATVTTASRYIGRVLVERITNQEQVEEEGTVMFEGPYRVTVNAGGTWLRRRVCIV